MRLSYSLRVGLLLVIGLLFLAVAVVSQTSDTAHAQTDDDALEFASGDCRDYTGGWCRSSGSAIRCSRAPSGVLRSRTGSPATCSRASVRYSNCSR